MAPIRPTFGSARVRVMQIAYYCDVTNDSGPVIPLGVMVDIYVGSVRGLGLRARAGLTNEELCEVGSLMRDSLRRPFVTLSREFGRVWRADINKDVFADLPLRHMGALRFEAQQSLKARLPQKLAIQDADQSDAVTGWAKDQLRVYCITGYLKLLERHWNLAAMPGSGSSDNLKERLSA